MAQKQAQQKAAPKDKDGGYGTKDGGYGTNKAPAAAGGPVDDFDAFEGDDIGEADIDGWYDPNKGVEAQTVVGKILSYLPLPDTEHGGDRPNVLITLERPCLAVKNQEAITLQPGQVIAVGIRVKLIDLLYYVEGRYRVFVQVTEKVKLTKGKSMWKFRMKAEKGAKKGALPRSTKRDMAALKEQLSRDESLPAGSSEPDDNTPF